MERELPILDSPFKKLSNESLVDALVEYYYKYRTIVETTADAEEYLTARNVMYSIFNELNVRQGLPPNPLLSEFLIQRQNTVS